MEDCWQVHDPALRPGIVGPQPVFGPSGHEDVGHDGQDGPDGGDEGVAQFEDFAQERKDEEEADEPADPLYGQVVGEVGHVPVISERKEKKNILQYEKCFHLHVRVS